MKQNKVICVIFVIAIIVVAIMAILKGLANFIYPDKYSEYIEKYADEYEVDRNLVYAIIKQESNFNPEVNSSKGATGLMQLMKETAEEVAIKVDCAKIDLKDPEINIKLGTKYLSDLIEKYGNERIAIVAYNAGSGNVDSWLEKGVIKKDGTDLENVPYKETNMYVRKVFKNYEIYCKLY